MALRPSEAGADHRPGWVIWGAFTSRGSEMRAPRVEHPDIVLTIWAAGAIAFPFVLFGQP